VVAWPGRLLVGAAVLVGAAARVADTPGRASGGADDPAVRLVVDEVVDGDGVGGVGELVQRPRRPAVPAVRLVRGVGGWVAERLPGQFGGRSGEGLRVVGGVGDGRRIAVRPGTGGWSGCRTPGIRWWGRRCRCRCAGTGRTGRARWRRGRRWFPWCTRCRTPGTGGSRESGRSSDPYLEDFG
jgi:hypothetical protein